MKVYYPQMDNINLFEHKIIHCYYKKFSHYCENFLYFQKTSYISNILTSALSIRWISFISLL